jgi:3-oxoacyl-[acyl-carrier-protein] synthase II
VGIGTEETWQALLDGRSGAGPITLFDASQHSTRFACEVKGFDPLRWIEKKDVKKVDRFIQFAIAAADLAMKDAAFAVDPAAAGSGASPRSSASTRRSCRAGPGRSARSSSPP